MARRLVIIGGDAAGMSAATQVRRMKTVDEIEIVVFERSSRTSYAALRSALPGRRIRDVSRQSRRPHP